MPPYAIELILDFSKGTLTRLYPTEFYAYGSTAAVIEDYCDFKPGEAIKIKGTVYQISSTFDVKDLDGNKIANGVNLSRLGADKDAV